MSASKLVAALHVYAAVYWLRLLVAQVDANIKHAFHSKESVSAHEPLPQYSPALNPPP